MSSLTGWSRVLAGSRLVASAAVKQISEEASTVAARAARHGLDVSSKAQGSSQELVDIFNNMAQSAASIVYQNHRHQRVNGENDQGSNSSSYPSGNSPYESQLHSYLKKEKENITETASSTTGSEAFDPDLYLLHAPKRNKNSNGQVPTATSDPTRKLDDQSNHIPKDQRDPYFLHAQKSRMGGEESSDIPQSATETNQLESRSSPELSETSSSTSTSTIAMEQAIATESRILSSPQNPEGLISDEPIRLEQGEAVPSTRFGRAFGFAKLGFGLAMGTAAEFASRLVPGRQQSNSSSVVATDANADRLAATLCRMRGAALKMGQMLSIQDESLLPPALSRALLQVRQGAHAMPNYQLFQQLESQLGHDWREKFESFDESPFAAASIGQVHRATIERDGRKRNVVVKVQYPGVARSIESDLRNLSMLVTMTGLSPKGLFIENVIRVGRDELKVECNYINEMANQMKFRELVASDLRLVESRFTVPNVIDDLTSEQVITTDYAPGGTIDKVSHLDQEERNRIGQTILYLTMKELFDWRLMQTDPNWGNFLYDVGSRETTLIDFGATRSYSKEFVDGYLRIVWASANRDEATLMEQSRRMQFLTGEENDTMLRAHKLSGYTVGEPFWTDDEPFDFRGSNISTRMGEHTSVFLQHRLT